MNTEKIKGLNTSGLRSPETLSLYKLAIIDQKQLKENLRLKDLAGMKS